MSGGPNSYIIFPDPCLTGSKNIDSIEPVAAGEYVGPTDSENDNRGSLVATMQGKYVDPNYTTLTSEDKKFDFRVQTAGGINGGTWAHRPNKTSTVGVMVSDQVGSVEITLGTQLVVNDIDTPLTRYKDSITPYAALPATSALAKVIAINENTELHGVTASSDAGQIIFSNPMLGGTLNNGELSVNDVDLLNGSGPVVFLAVDSSSALRNAINAHTVTHGITASLIGGNLKLTATAANLTTGANLGLFVDAGVAGSLGWTGTTVSIQRSGITLTSDTHIDLRPSTDAIGVLGISSEVIFQGVGIVGGTVGGYQLYINDFDLVGPVVPFLVTAFDGTSTLRNAINARTYIHGITASLDGGVRLKLSATSGNLRLHIVSGIHVTLGYLGSVDTLISGDLYESNKNFYGYNEERYLHFPHGGLVQVSGSAASGVFVPRLNRELLYTAEDTIGNVATINVGYRNIDDRNDVWTQTTINFVQKDFFGIGSEPDIFKVCSMSDGTLRMMSRTDRNDINIWSSVDGLKWELLSFDIASKYLVTYPVQILSPKLSGSGDYLRLAWIDQSGGFVDYFRSIVSSDGGASWIEPTDQVAPAIHINGDDVDQYIYTITGLGDQAGTFLLHYMNNIQQIETGIAVGTGAFVDTNIVKITGVPAASSKAHITAVRGPDDFWLVLCYYIQPTFGYVDWHRAGWEFVLYRINPSQPLGAWTSNNYLTGAQGTIRFVPCYMNLINCGKYLSFFSGAVDATDVPSLVVESNRTIYFQLGGWDMSPISNYTDYRPESTTTMYSESEPYPLPIDGWHVPFGVAAGAGSNVSPGTPWTRTLSQTTSNYSSSRQRLSDNGGFIGQYYINELDDTTWSTTSPSDSQPDWMPTTVEPGGLVIEAEVKSDLGYEEVLASYPVTVFFDVHGSDHFGPVVGNHNRIYLRVVIANDGVALIDVNAGAAPIDNSFISSDMSVWHRIRLVISTVNVGTLAAPVLESQAMLCIKKMGGYDELSTRDWERVGPFTITESVVAGVIQILRFGQLANNGIPHVDRSSSWRSINVFGSSERGFSPGMVKNSALGQFRAYDLDTDWPQHLRGRSLSGNPINMGYGISARWGGASGFSGDYFNGDTKYQYGAQNLVLPSPRLQYRSELDLTRSSSDTFKVVFVADPDNTMIMFNWNCIAGFNSNVGGITIRVSQDKVTWTTPAALHQTYISRVYSPDILSMESPNKVVVRLTGGPGYMPEQAEWNTSDSKPFYVNLIGTIGSPPSPFVKTANIVECIKLSETIYHLILDTDIDITLLGTLTAITVFSGRWVYNVEDGSVRNDRYIEISGDRDLGNATNQALGMGTLVIGIREDLTVPLEWSVTSNEQPNITNYRTKGGLTWAYPEGPPQRTITGRLVGDVSQEQRNTLRQLLRSHSQYETKPVVLVLDDSIGVASRSAPYSDPNNVILGRITSGAQLDNAGWYEQTKSNSPAADIDIWKQAGDMAITLEEEV